MKDQETKQGKQEPGLGSLQRSTAGDLLSLASPYLPKVPQPPKISLPGDQALKTWAWGRIWDKPEQSSWHTECVYVHLINILCHAWVLGKGICGSSPSSLSLCCLLELKPTWSSLLNGGTSWADGQCSTSHHRGWIRLLDYTLIHCPNVVLVF